MTAPEPVLLLSLQPRYADAILDAAKTIELRRQRINAGPGTTVIIYATTPVRAIVGTATLGRIDLVAPGALWTCHRQHLGLSKSEYDAYLHGVTTAVALHLSQPARLDQPITLATLRSEYRLQPPRSYRFIPPTDALVHKIISQPSSQASAGLPSLSNPAPSLHVTTGPATLTVTHDRQAGRPSRRIVADASPIPYVACDHGMFRTTLHSDQLDA